MDYKMSGSNGPDAFRTSTIKLANLLRHVAEAFDLEVVESHNLLKAEPQGDGTKEAIYRMTFAVRQKTRN